MWLEASISLATLNTPLDSRMFRKVHVRSSASSCDLAQATILSGVRWAYLFDQHAG
jgi:hypothetical protein